MRVGVVDSGGPADELAGAMAFDPEGLAILPQPDRLGHGTAVARVLRAALPSVAIRHAQVFDDRPVTSALRVAAALDWLRETRTEVVCLSLGLAADRTILARAVARCIAEGMILVAAQPARGGTTYPGAYPGVIAATGDARCGWDEVSRLGPRLFGAWCNSPERGATGMGGASLATARIAAHVASLAPCGHVAALDRLGRLAQHHGPERRAG